MKCVEACKVNDFSDTEKEKLYHYVGKTCRSLKRYDDSERYLLKSLEERKKHFPSCSGASDIQAQNRLPYSNELEKLYNDIIKIYVSLNQIEKALKYAKELFIIQSEAIEECPTRIDTSYNIARFYSWLQRYDAVEKYAKLTMEQQSDHEGAQRIMDRVLLKKDLKENISTVLKKAKNNCYDSRSTSSWQECERNPGKATSSMKSREP